MPMPQTLAASYSSMLLGSCEALDTLPNPLLLLTLYRLSRIALCFQMSPKKFGTFEIAHRLCTCDSEFFD